MNFTSRSIASWAACGIATGLVHAQGNVPELPVGAWPVGVNAQDVAVGDFDGDGHADFVVASGAAAHVFWCDGNRRYDTSITLPALGTLRSIAAADFDGDGDADIGACVDPTRELVTWLADGAGGFVAQPPVTGAVLPSFYMSTGDLNGDGNTDIVWITNHAEVFLGDGAGGFAAPVTTLINVNTTSLAIDDWNGDGRDDLVVGTSFSFPAAVFLISNGSGGFTSQSSIGLSDSVRSVASIDCNADGKRDIAFGLSSSSNAFDVLLGDGNGGFGAAIVSRPSVTLKVLASPLRSMV